MDFLSEWRKTGDFQPMETKTSNKNKDFLLLEGGIIFLNRQFYRAEFMYKGIETS